MIIVTKPGILDEYEKAVKTFESQADKLPPNQDRTRINELIGEARDLFAKIDALIERIKSDKEMIETITDRVEDELDKIMRSLKHINQKEDEQT